MPLKEILVKFNKKSIHVKNRFDVNHLPDEPVTVIAEVGYEGDYCINKKGNPNLPWLNETNIVAWVFNTNFLTGDESQTNFRTNQALFIEGFF